MVEESLAGCSLQLAAVSDCFGTKAVGMPILRASKTRAFGTQERSNRHAPPIYKTTCQACICHCRSEKRAATSTCIRFETGCSSIGVLTVQVKRLFA